MRGLKGKPTKGNIPKRTTPAVEKKVVPAVTAVESAKTHSDVWDKRWAGKGLDKTFGTDTPYGIPTRPDRWRDYSQASWQTREIPEYSTGPWRSTSGVWGGPQWGKQGAARPRWYKDPTTGKWRRG